MVVTKPSKIGIRKATDLQAIAVNTIVTHYTPGAANTGRTCIIRKIWVFSPAGSGTLILSQGGVQVMPAFQVPSGIDYQLPEDQIPAHEFTAAIQATCTVAAAGNPVQLKMEVEEFQGSTAHA